MSEAHKNFAYSLVATAPSPATSGTSLTVTTGQGTLFPTVPFNVVVWPTGVQPISTNAEILTVTLIAGDVFTTVRTQENTPARSIVVGDQIAAAITADTLQDVEGVLAPDHDTSVQAGMSTILPRKLVIASGKKYIIGSGGILRIL
jgi:hypothetical protein